MSGPDRSADSSPRADGNLRAKVDDLEATLMLLGSDLEALTLAMHEQARQLDRIHAELSRLREQGLEPASRPEEERPPHY